MIKYSICILTFNREKLLIKLIESILIQENVIIDEIELIIIDNNTDARLHESLIIYFDNKITIRYYHQPIKNLSLSRNLAIKVSKGIYIVFIDDDEYADKKWLHSLTKCAQKFEADVVFGNLKNYFEEGVPKYLQHDIFYYPRLPLISQPAKFYYTGNCLIKREVLIKTGLLFDNNFGITGGEDVVFFEKIQKLGYKMYYCAEAQIFELVDRRRGNLKYLFYRHFRYGNIFIKRKIYLDNRMINKFKYLLKSFLKIIFFSFKLPFSILNLKYFITNILKITSAIGELFSIFNLELKMYK